MAVYPAARTASTLPSWTMRAPGAGSNRGARPAARALRWDSCPAADRDETRRRGIEQSKRRRHQIARGRGEVPAFVRIGPAQRRAGDGEGAGAGADRHHQRKDGQPFIVRGAVEISVEHDIRLGVEASLPRSMSRNARS